MKKILFHTINKHFPIAILILITALIKYKIILFGLPYSFHPDETYIYKDPLKILLLYKNFDFSQSYNLVDWLFTLWTGIIFVIGKIFNQWGNFNTFQDMLLIEDGKIILAYRILSLIASTLAITFLYKLISKITADKLLQVLFVLTLILNPIELLSDNWIKYDAYVYLTLSFLLYYSYSYFFLEQKEKQKMLYIASILAIAVRIELVAFFVSIIILETYELHKQQPQKLFWKKLKKIDIYLFTGIILYCLATLWPISFIYNHFFSSENHIGVAKSFQEVIFFRLIDTFYSGKILGNIWSNSVFYCTTWLAALGPILLATPILAFIKIRETRYLMLFFILILLFVVMYAYSATHYFLSLSVIIIFTNCLFISKLKRQRTQIILSAFNVLYVSSLSIIFLYHISFNLDPRLYSATYLLRNTSTSDLLAVETHSMNGYGPVINECKEVLLEKSRVIKQIGSGTGETYKLKSQNVSDTCRNILDVFSEDYFAGSDYEGYWINTYNKDNFMNRNPDYYITSYSISPTSEFYSNILENYQLDTIFKCNISDMRLAFLMQSEFYLKPISIYKKIN